MLGARTFSLICFLDTKAFQIGIKLNLLALQATSSSCYHILWQLARRHPWRQPQWEALEPVTHHFPLTTSHLPLTTFNFQLSTSLFLLPSFSSSLNFQFSVLHFFPLPYSFNISITFSFFCEIAKSNGVCPSTLLIVGSQPAFNKTFTASG